MSRVTWANDDISLDHVGPMWLLQLCSPGRCLHPRLAVSSWVPMGATWVTCGLYRVCDGHWVGRGRGEALKVEGGAVGGLCCGMVGLQANGVNPDLG